MNFQLLKNLIRILCILSLIVFAAACEEESGGSDIGGTNDNGSQPAPTPTPTSTPTPTPVAAGTFKIELVNPSDLLQQKLRLAYRLDGSIPATATSVVDWDTACSIDPTSADIEDKNVICYLEGEELDFYANGFELKITVDSGTCDYVFEYPYYYFKRKAGIGPTEARLYKNANDELVDCTPAVNTEDDSPKCDYDYSDNEGPNCCIGTYNKRIYTDAACTTADPLDGNNEDDVKWGGKLSECLAGPGTFSSFKTEDGVYEGFPVGKFYGTSAIDGEAHTIDYSSPIPEDKRISPISIANYFKPDKFGDTPSHLNGEESEYPLGMKDVDLEADLIAGGFLGVGTTIRHNPYYVWACSDSAREIQGIIRLVVRDWNENPEFEKFDAGNPDTTGTDIFGDPLDDYYDWDALLDELAREYPNHE